MSSEINYVINDPRAFRAPRILTTLDISLPTNSRPTFKFKSLSPPGKYGYGTDEFNDRQCSHVLNNALLLWKENVDDFENWYSSASLKVHPKYDLAERNDALAGYQRVPNGPRLLFNWVSVSPDSFSHAASSTDIVTHELGHAVLDSIKPEIGKDTFPLFEVSAFHEAFADCFSLFYAINDSAANDLQAISLIDRNFGSNPVTRIGELAFYLERVLGNTNSSLRNAVNRLKWSPTPHNHFDSYHQYSQVFTGAIFDTLKEYCQASSSLSTEILRTAFNSLMSLLCQGIKNAPVSRHYFVDVATAMAELDRGDQYFSFGRHLITGFSKHGIHIRSRQDQQPSLEWAGPKIKVTGNHSFNHIVPRKIQQRIRDMYGLKGARLEFQNLCRANQNRQVQFSFNRKIAIGKLSKLVSGVYVHCGDMLTLGNSGKFPVLIKEPTQERVLIDSVHDYVESLLANRAIDFKGDRKNLTTHRIKNNTLQRQLYT